MGPKLQSSSARASKDTNYSTPQLERVSNVDESHHDSGIGSEVSTPGLESQLAEISLGNDVMPPFEVVEPVCGEQRVLTVVLLHAYDSSGAELKHQLLDATKCSSGKTLREELPGVRWIFPNAPIRYHAKCDKPVEKCRMWVDYCLHDDKAEGIAKMEESLQETTNVIQQIFEAEWKRIGKAKKFNDRVFWEDDEIVFGGYLHSAAPALSTWILSGAKLAGFMSIRGISPDQEVMTEQDREDVRRGQPPRRGSDFDKNTDEFIKAWISSVSRYDDDTIKNMAATPVLLTMHDEDRNWLFDSKKLATALYKKHVGPSDMLAVQCFPSKSESERGGGCIQELDYIQEYLKTLVAFKMERSDRTFKEWVHANASS
ncbi:hypothetical protein IFR05_012700 [Cadophora sp. M221]|nr:hypothetical protein IFR05_012700 [Cadophora sp. M221]